jgi:hypothetical protein
MAPLQPCPATLLLASPAMNFSLSHKFSHLWQLPERACLRLVPADEPARSQPADNWLFVALARSKHSHNVARQLSTILASRLDSTRSCQANPCPCVAAHIPPHPPSAARASSCAVLCSTAGHQTQSSPGRCVTVRRVNVGRRPMQFYRLRILLGSQQGAGMQWWGHAPAHSHQPSKTRRMCSVQPVTAASSGCTHLFL